MDNLKLKLNGMIVTPFTKNEKVDDSISIREENSYFAIEGETAIRCLASDEVVLCLKLGHLGLGFIKVNLEDSIKEVAFNSLKKILGILQEQGKDINPKDITVIIPPCLTFSHTPVNEEIVNKVLELGYKGSAKGTSNELFIDVPLLNVLQLRKLGVDFENILIANMDTKENPDLFYSKANGDDKLNVIEINLI